MPRYFLEIAYLGTAYNGWQIQQNAATVQQHLHEALSEVVQQNMEITGASRTDTGVHARQTFAHFDLSENLPENFIPRINRNLPSDIVVHNIAKVEDTAHTRFDAKQRHYEYAIHFQKNPFLNGRSMLYHWRKLDLDIMQQAAEYLLSITDFDSFCKAHSQVKTKVCQLNLSKWEFQEKTNQLFYHVAADRFLRGMVRGLVGTMLFLGRGKIDLDQFKMIIDSKDNRNADFSAPPEGLYLTKIEYPYPLKFIDHGNQYILKHA